MVKYLCEVATCLAKLNLLCKRPGPTAMHLCIPIMDLVYWMIGMSRFKPLHERRPSMSLLAQTEIKDLSLVRTKGATFL